MNSFKAKFNTSFTFPSLNFTKVGYTFKGWNLKRNDDGMWFYPNVGWKTDSEAKANGYTKQLYSKNGLTVVDESWLTRCNNATSFTFYATWTPNILTTYFHANGGAIKSDKADTYKISSNFVYSVADNAKWAQKWTYNNTKTNGIANASSFGLYKTGYHFAGWSTKATGGTVLDDNDTTVKPTDITSNIKNGNCSVTLYAQWVPNTLSVYYNANGGAINADKAGTYKLASNIVSKVSDNTKYIQKWTYNKTNEKGLTNASTFGLYRNGYTFAGWSTKANGGTVFDDNDATVKPTDITSNIKNGNCSVTLYAQWKCKHNYKSTVTKAATCTTAGTETFTCATCGDKYTKSIAALGHAAVTDKAVPATCTTAGKTQGSHCSRCNVVITAQKTVAATGHNYGNAVWTWNGYDSASVKLTCANNASHTQNINATITSKTVEAGCAAGGETVYTATATFNGKTYTDSKIKSTSATGHQFSEPVWTWIGFEKATAKFVCKADSSHVETVTANITSIKTEATCTQNGKTEYTASVTFNGKTYKDVKTVTENALGHRYTAPVWQWNENGEATATFVCANDAEHVQKLSATVKTTTTLPTCTEDGKTVYTASVILDGKTYTDSKSEIVEAIGHNPVIDSGIEATCTTAGKTQGSHCSECGTVIVAQQTVNPLGHSYGEPEWAWTGFERAEAIFTCEHDIEHNGAISAQITSVAVPETCTESGKISYTATAKFNGIVYTDTAVEIIEPAGHALSDWETIKEPEVGVEGREKRVCSKCNYTEEQNIPALVEKVVVSLEIVSLPTKTTYNYKSTPSTEGLKVVATYSDGSEVDVTDRVTITGLDTQKPVGEKTATVEFEGKTATFTYTVKYAWWQWIIRIVLLGFIWYDL